MDDQLYESQHGQDILAEENVDSSAAAARLLGEDIADILGRTRLSELVKRWPGTPDDVLFHSMTVPNAVGWSGATERRQALVKAMHRGIGLDDRG